MGALYRIRHNLAILKLKTISSWKLTSTKYETDVDNINRNENRLLLRERMLLYIIE